MTIQEAIDRIVDAAERVARDKLKGGQEILFCKEIDPVQGVVFATRQALDSCCVDIGAVVVSFDEVDQSMFIFGVNTP